MTAPICKWCGEPYTLRRRGGGLPRAFCCFHCRGAYHTAARRYSERLLAEGKISMADLRRLQPTRTASVAPREELPGSAPDLPSGGETGSSAPAPGMPPAMPGDRGDLQPCTVEPAGDTEATPTAGGGGRGWGVDTRSDAARARAGEPSGAPPQPEAAPVTDHGMDAAELERQANFLLKRQPLDPEHERYAGLLAATIYRNLVGPMVRAGFLTRERAAELGAETTP